MYARVVTVQIKPGMTEEATKIYQDSVVPASKEQPGSEGLFLLVDRGTGKGYSISLWDSEAAMIASESSGYLNQQLAKFGPLLAAAPTTERLEVAVKA